MADTPCAQCARPVPDRRPLCHECAAGLVEQLLDVPRLVVELHNTRAGLGRTHVTAPGGRGAEPPLPIRAIGDGDARTGAELAGEWAYGRLERALVEWSRILAEELDAVPALHTAALVDLVTKHRARDDRDPAALAPIPATVAEQLAVWLARHRTALRAHQAGPGLLDAITRATGRIALVIDPGNKRYLGRCPTTLDDGNKCDHDLYAPAEETWVRCRACRTQHAVAELENAALAAGEDALYTIPDLARATARLGAEIPIRTLYRWAHEGRLAARGWHHRDTRGTRITDHAIGPNDKRVYRLGDALEQRRADTRNGAA